MHHSSARSFLLGLGMLLALTGLATSGLVLGGCSDDRTEKLESAVSGLAKTSASVTALRVGINRTNATLEKLKNVSEVAANIDLLKEQVAGLTKQATFIKASQDELTARKNAVVATWREEIAAVKDPVLKASAAERSARLADDVGKIAANVTAAKEAYQPYMASLDELTRFLDKDQTPSGVKVAAPAIDHAVKAGIEVQVQLQLLSNKLDAITGEITPAVK